MLCKKGRKNFTFSSDFLCYFITTTKVQHLFFPFNNEPFIKLDLPFLFPALWKVSEPYNYGCLQAWD